MFWIRDLLRLFIRPFSLWTYDSFSQGVVAFSSQGDRIALTQIEQMIDGKYALLGHYDTQDDNLTWTGLEKWQDNKVIKSTKLAKTFATAIACEYTMRNIGVDRNSGFSLLVSQAPTKVDRIVETLWGHAHSNSPINIPHRVYSRKWSLQPKIAQPGGPFDMSFMLEIELKRNSIWLQIPQDRTIVRRVLRTVSLSLFICMSTVSGCGIVIAIALIVFNIWNNHRRWVFRRLLTALSKAL